MRGSLHGTYGCTAFYNYMERALPSPKPSFVEDAIDIGVFLKVTVDQPLTIYRKTAEKAGYNFFS